MAMGCFAQETLNNEDTLWSGGHSPPFSYKPTVNHLRFPRYLSRPSTVGLFVLTHPSTPLCRTLGLMQIGLALFFVAQSFQLGC